MLPFHVIIKNEVFFMRKLLIYSLIVFFLTGCTSKKEVSAELTAYQGYYKAISEYEKFSKTSNYYNVSAEMSKLPDGTYRYYIFVDNAQIAMYDITILAIESGTSFTTATKMMPSIGIFDMQEYSMIPNQSYAEKGFVKGLMLSGESAEESIILKMLVEWKDKTLEKTSREYISINLSLDGIHYPEENSGEGKK